MSLWVHHLPYPGCWFLTNQGLLYIFLGSKNPKLDLRLPLASWVSWVGGTSKIAPISGTLDWELNWKLAFLFMESTVCTSCYAFNYGISSQTSWFSLWFLEKRSGLPKFLELFPQERLHLIEPALQEYSSKWSLENLDTCAWGVETKILNFPW